MPTDRTRPAYSRGQRRLLTALAGLVVAALAAGAYVLTYAVLRELALAGGVGRRWAPLYPVMADTLVAMTILSLVVTRGARWWTRLLRWALLLALVAGGAALHVQHSVWGYASLPDDAVKAGVAVAPHVMLVIAVWLWLTMFKQIRVARPTAEDAGAPAETQQRGHVKVLEPAAPPLALEAPAETAPEPHAPFADEPDELIPFPPETSAPEPTTAPAPEVRRPEFHEPEAREPEALEPGAHEPEAHEAHEHEADTDEPASQEPVQEPAQEFGGFEDGPYGGGLSSEPAPPLDALPEPRPPLDPVPALLPTDVELVRSRDHEEAPRRPVAATTRPDIVVPGPAAPADPPGADEDLHDPPPADRAEDPDAGDSPAKDWNPPPSGNFRSGPTPPAD
ncbi:DUF2637 domain-containing protein [Actinomadura sp. NAK00032]|uniref:DUF2637 domain-containing protein n=1 Tax=Actinomadura sp. NAK00032 TaxID=2742128 RepID=UPI001590432E|nr:DUF2637 domain-containing protein [Actinomadura sp. NAK00032]QKW33724.1 DUF2637 domain-containing protein [Actinomadura sp. NAK00032]